MVKRNVEAKKWDIIIAFSDKVIPPVTESNSKMFKDLNYKIRTTKPLH